MSIKIGNIFNTSGISKAISDNISGGLSGITTGIKAIGKNMIDEAFGMGGSGFSKPSAYPLGDEWQPDPAYAVTIVFTDPNTQQLTDVQGYMPETISIGLGAEFSSPLESVGDAMSSGPLGMTARMFGYKVSANVFSMLLWSGSSHIDLTLELRFVALRDTHEDVIVPIRKLYSLITPSIESFSVTQGPVQLGMVKSPGPSLEFAGSTSVTEQGAAIGGEIANAVGKVSGAVVSNATDLIQGKSTAVQAAVNIGGATVEAGGSAINQVLKDLRVKNNIAIVLGQFAYLRSVVVKDVSPAYNVKADEDGNWTDATVSIQVSTFVSPTNIDIPDLVGFRQGGRTQTSDPTSVSSDLATLAGGGLAGAMSKVSSKASSSLTELAKSVGLDVKFPKTDDLINSLNLKPITSVIPVKSTQYDNLGSIGRDVGLGSKVSLDENPYKLGMSQADINSFNLTLNT